MKRTPDRLWPSSESRTRAGDGTVQQARGQLADVRQAEAKSGGMDGFQAYKGESGGLKRMPVDAMLKYGPDVSTGTEVVTPLAHREAAAHLQSAHGTSERRACR